MERLVKICMLVAFLINLTSALPSSSSSTNTSHPHTFERHRIKRAEDNLADSVGLINSLPLIDIASMIGQADELVKTSTPETEHTSRSGEEPVTIKDEEFRTVITFEEKIGKELSADEISSRPTTQSSPEPTTQSSSSTESLVQVTEDLSPKGKAIPAVNNELLDVEISTMTNDKNNSVQEVVSQDNSTREFSQIETKSLQSEERFTEKETENSKLQEAEKSNIQESQKEEIEMTFKIPPVETSTTLQQEEQDNSSNNVSNNKETTVGDNVTTELVMLAKETPDTKEIATIKSVSFSISQKEEVEKKIDEETRSNNITDTVTSETPAETKEDAIESTTVLQGNYTRSSDTGNSAGSTEANATEIDSTILTKNVTGRRNDHTEEIEATTEKTSTESIPVTYTPVAQANDVTESKALPENDLSDMNVNITEAIRTINYTNNIDIDKSNNTSENIPLPLQSGQESVENEVEKSKEPTTTTVNPAADSTTDNQLRLTIEISNETINNTVSQGEANDQEKPSDIGSNNNNDKTNIDNNDNNSERPDGKTEDSKSNLQTKDSSFSLPTETTTARINYSEEPSPTENTNSEDVTKTASNQTKTVTTSTTEVVFVVYSSKANDEDTANNTNTAVASDDKITQYENNTNDGQILTVGANVTLTNNTLSEEETDVLNQIRDKDSLSAHNTEESKNQTNIDAESQRLDNEPIDIAINNNASEQNKSNFERESQKIDTDFRKPQNIPNGNNQDKINFDSDHKNVSVKNFQNYSNIVNKSNENQGKKDINKFKLRPRPKYQRLSNRKKSGGPGINSLDVGNSTNVPTIKDETDAHKAMINSRRIIMDKMNSQIIQDEVKKVLSNDKHRFQVGAKNKPHLQRSEQSELLKEKLGLKPVIGVRNKPIKSNENIEHQSTMDTKSVNQAKENIDEENIEIKYENETTPIPSENISNSTGGHGNTEKLVEEEEESIGIETEPLSNDNNGMSLKERLVQLRQEKIKDRYMKTVQNHRNNEKIIVSTRSNDIKNRINAMIDKQNLDEKVASSKFKFTNFQRLNDSDGAHGASIKYTPIRKVKPAIKIPIDRLWTEESTSNLENKGSFTNYNNNRRGIKYVTEDSQDDVDKENAPSINITPMRKNKLSPTPQNNYNFMSERKPQRSQFRPSSFSSKRTTIETPQPENEQEEIENELHENPIPIVPVVLDERIPTSIQPNTGNGKANRQGESSKKLNLENVQIKSTRSKPTIPSIRISPNRFSHLNKAVPAPSKFPIPSQTQDQEGLKPNSNEKDFESPSETVETSDDSESSLMDLNLRVDPNHQQLNGYLNQKVQDKVPNEYLSSSQGNTNEVRLISNMRRISSPRQGLRQNLHPRLLKLSHSKVAN
ncbi:hypothetical protein M8J76_003632 [Diaphorina citri]|nr:hypothetical protein M8J76_003632 [Diaphorina citri]